MSASGRAADGPSKLYRILLGQFGAGEEPVEHMEPVHLVLESAPSHFRPADLWVPAHFLVKFLGDGQGDICHRMADGIRRISEFP